MKLTKLKKNTKLALAIIIILAVTAMLSGVFFMYYYYAVYGIRPEITAKAQSVILVTGEGISGEYVEASEIYAKANGLSDGFAMSGMGYSIELKTRSLNIYPSDSSASGSAMASGKKVHNGRVSHLRGRNLETVSQLASQKGMRVGIVTNGYVTAGVSATFSAYASSSSHHNAIARQQADNKNLNVLFGLGQEHFNGISGIETENRGFHKTFNELSACDKEDAFLIFDTAISQETFLLLIEKAISMLDNEHGFLLIVDISGSGSAVKNRDMKALVERVMIFDRAVEEALSYTKFKQNSTLIATGTNAVGKFKPYDKSVSSINNSLFASNTPSHRSAKMYIHGTGMQELRAQGHEYLDNTDIYHIIKQLIRN
ncbi:MAG: alkaline phosphatase [Firmicutes bacterium]|nr:alkaline phosphatase [Bacillota bacterium]